MNEQQTRFEAPITQEDRDTNPHGRAIVAIVAPFVMPAGFHEGRRSFADRDPVSHSDDEWRRWKGC